MKLEMERTNVKAVQRIGKPDTNGPVKVELSTEQEKVTLLQNLRKLKDDERYKGIGITEDYTLSERKLIQEYNARAKEKMIMIQRTSVMYGECVGRQKMAYLSRSSGR